MKIKKYSAVFFLAILFINACGGGGGSTTDSDEETTANMNAVNTNKLIGTPFEGLLLGDDLDPYTFICDTQYRTTTVTEFPIKIFAAMFPAFWEQDIKDGIDIANNAAGFELYEWTDEWADDVRVIYRVTNLEGGVVGKTSFLYQYFNGNSFSENEAVDWVIRLQVDGDILVGHELGHATGIGGHYLIDYDANTVGSLEEGSLMSQEESDPPTLTDYNFMMSMQGQIMQEHLNDSSGTLSDPCD